MAKNTPGPRCLNCGKKLRRYRYRNEEWGAGKEWGDYGDGHFCGLTCGYTWAVMWLGRDPVHAERLHGAMSEVMNKHEG